MEEETDGFDAEEEAPPQLTEAEIEAENAKLRSRTGGRGRRRCSVSAECGVNITAPFTPPVFEKSPDQFARIAKACAECFLFADLDKEASHHVFAAMKSKSAAAGEVIINASARIARWRRRSLAPPLADAAARWCQLGASPLPLSLRRTLQATERVQRRFRLARDRTIDCLLPLLT